MGNEPSKSTGNRDSHEAPPVPSLLIPTSEGTSEHRSQGTQWHQGAPEEWPGQDWGAASQAVSYQLCDVREVHCSCSLSPSVLQPQWPFQGTNQITPPPGTREKPGPDTEALVTQQSLVTGAAQDKGPVKRQVYAGQS